MVALHRLLSADGLRTYKKVGSTVHEYEYSGDKLIYEKRGDTRFYYRYDSYGNIASIRRLMADGSDFTLFPITNARGDVVEVRLSNGNLYARYIYDSWGNIVSVRNPNGYEIADPNHYAHQNPFRYRGYYYDAESGLYYLQSRYYDPVTCRFVNADGQLAEVGDTVQGYNLYAYCFNDPVNASDNEGEWPSWAKKVATAVAVVAAVAIVAAVTVATAGTGTLSAAVAVGAAKGAAVGMLTGAAIGAASGAVSNRVKTGSWNGSGKAALNGMGDGALSGALSGAVAGGVSGGISHAAKTVGFKIQEIGRLKPTGKSGNGNLGVKYQINKSNGKPTVKSFEFHANHAHKGHKPHWQRNTWNPYNNSISSKKSVHWSLWGKRI